MEIQKVMSSHIVLYTLSSCCLPCPRIHLMRHVIFLGCEQSGIIIKQTKIDIIVGIWLETGI